MRARTVRSNAGWIEATSRLRPGTEIIVQRAKWAKPDLVYPMTVDVDNGDHIVVVGPYSDSVPLDLGYVRFEPDDWFVEHFWRTRWFSVCDVQDRLQDRKGWYCDVTRPAEVVSGRITSVDLDLDLWVPVGDDPVLTLDEDEFVASDLPRTDPAAAAQARQALADLQDAALDRFARLLR